jgi:hypothetical protein
MSTVLYLNLSQPFFHYVFLIISYVFSSTKSQKKRAEQVLPGNGGGGKVGGPNNVYTCKKCKTDKIKEKKREREKGRKEGREERKEKKQHNQSKTKGK